MPVPAIKIKLVGKNFLDPMPTTEKIRFILDEVEAGQVLVLERGLTPTEETQLIEATMGHIDQDRFTGIEMQSYGSDGRGGVRRFWKAGRRPRPRMVVIGPANLVRGVAKDAHSLQALLFPPSAAAEGA